jgi:hypothetical protein
MTVARADVWAANLDDRPGGLAEKLSALAEAGAQFEFVIARRAPDKPGAGVVFLTPLKGAAQMRAAKKAGFEKIKGLHSLRIEGPDEPGLGARMTLALAQAGINLRGLSAAAVGARSVVHLTLDSTADAAQATQILKRL